MMKLTMLSFFGAFLLLVACSGQVVPIGEIDQDLTSCATGKFWCAASSRCQDLMDPTYCPSSQDGGGGAGDSGSAHDAADASADADAGGDADASATCVADEFWCASKGACQKLMDPTLCL